VYFVNTVDQGPLVRTGKCYSFAVRFAIYGSDLGQQATTTLSPSPLPPANSSRYRVRRSWRLEKWRGRGTRGGGPHGATAGCPRGARWRRGRGASGPGARRRRRSPLEPLARQLDRGDRAGAASGASYATPRAVVPRRGPSSAAPGPAAAPAFPRHSPRAART
jgi:hypothetical protein